MIIERVVLGLDISTSITGYAVVDIDTNELMCYGHIDLRKTKCMFDKVEKVKQELANIKTDFNITNIYIEQPFTFFNSGGSSAQTMATLQKFNGIISWICYSLWNFKPNYIGASQARKTCSISVPRGQKAKQVVLDYILNTEKKFSIQKTRNGNPKPESYDRADAIVIAKAGAIKEIENEKNLKRME